MCSRFIHVVDLAKAHVQGLNRILNKNHSKKL